MKEVDLYPKISRWLNTNLPNQAWYIEAKIVKGRRFAFSTVAQHQIMNLTYAQHGLYYKIPDAGVSRKPFDIIWTGINQCKSFVMPVFYESRTKCTGYLIPINDFVRLKATSKKKSLLESEIPHQKVEL